MADTIRECLIQAIVARLDPLTPEASVLRCSNAYDATPAISLWDLDETAEKAKFGVTTATVQIVIEYVDEVGTANPSVLANGVLGNLIKSVVGTDPTFGGLATSVTYTSSTVDFPDVGGDTFAVRMGFNADYEYVSGDPYTQP